MDVSESKRSRMCWSKMVNMYILIWLIWIVEVTGAEETCQFPEFLQSSPAEGAIKPWTTRMWWLYLRHAPRWAEKQDIYVKNGQMWRHREHNLQPCETAQRKVYHKASLGPCSERELVYNLTCIHDEGDNTYRIIQYNADRTHRFTCLKFLMRSNNVVQVYEGPLSDTNDPDLCDSGGLRLDEWPWTAPWNNEPSFCPISGGFSFRTIRRLTNEDLCEDDWRRSHLEIECIKGDGMEFIAPKDSNCNPFLKQGDRKRLICWAGWEHGDYMFMIASDVGSQPRYCLRFPRSLEGEFSVLVYFSVICPTESDGKPHHGIEYYELRMYRKDHHLCTDENPRKCTEIITSSEMCFKDKTNAPHCPKTCGRCSTSTVSDVNGRRCWLDPTLYGDWQLYDNVRTAEVSIDKEKAVFSHLGAFQCLDTDNNGRRYKMASLFDNGCSPRYTCMEFTRPNNNVLQYRISPSERSELKMEDLCAFRDDQPPLVDSYRSFHFKNLILTKNLWPSYCGIQSVIPFNGTINGRHCTGSISDWNEEKCNLQGTISLKSDTCKELLLPLEYQCIAIIHDVTVPLKQLLLTRSLDGSNTYNCWVITSYVGGGQWPWRIMYQMPTAQCSLATEVDAQKTTSYIAALYLNDRNRTKLCKAVETRNKLVLNDINKSAATDLPYVIPNHEEADSYEKEVHVKTHLPEAPPSTNHPLVNDYNTDPPMWGVYGRGNIIGRRHLCRNILYVMLFQLTLVLIMKTLCR